MKNKTIGFGFVAGMAMLCLCVPSRAGLNSPVLINPSFEDPSLASGSIVNGIEGWWNSTTYTYTADEGNAVYPSTPYGENWSQLATQRWIYQQIGTYEENMDLDVTFLLGARTDKWGFPLRVSLWVGGNPAWARDMNTEYYSTGNPLALEVGATLIDSWTVGSLDQSASNVESIAYLSSKIGYTVGEPLWLQFNVEEGSTERVLIDHVDVALGSGAPLPDWVATAKEMHSHPENYTGQDFSDIAREIMGNGASYGGAQWNLIFPEVEPLLQDLAVSPTNLLDMTAIDKSYTDVSVVDAALLTWEARAHLPISMDQLFAHRDAFPVGETAPRISTSRALNVWSTDWHATILLDTGLYAAPGEVVELVVPPEIYQSDMKVQVGHEVSAADQWKSGKILFHPPYSTRTFDLTSATNRIGSTQGGLITFVAGSAVRGITNAIVSFNNVVEAPYFVAGETTNEEWFNGIRDRETYWGVIKTSNPAGGGINMIFKREQLNQLKDPELYVQERIHQTTFEEEFYAAPLSRPFRMHSDYHGIRGYSTFPQYMNPDSTQETDLAYLMRNGDAMAFHEYGHILDGYGSEQFWNGWTETQNNWAGIVMSYLTDQFGFTYKGDMFAQMRIRQFEDYIRSGEAVNFMDSNERYLQFVKQDMETAFSVLFGWENCKDIIAYIRNLPSSSKATGQQRQDLWLTRLAVETGYDVSPFVEQWGWTNSAAAKSAVGSYAELCPMEELGMKMVVKQNGSSTFTNLTDLGFSYEGTVLLDHVGTPSHGTLTDLGGGGYTYTPTAGYVGADTIPYTLRNGIGNTFDRTIPVMVLADEDYPALEAGDLYANTESWTTVDLTEDFGTNMVVVAMPVLPERSPAVVARIRNASGTGFEVKAQRTDGVSTALSGIHLQYMVVKKGLYHPDTHGIRLFADTVDSTNTASAAHWIVDQKIDYPFTSFTNTTSRGDFFRSPRIFGQVMSFNDSRWSTFWAADSETSKNPPMYATEGFYIGKHVGHDSEATRTNETLGFVVFEGGRTPNYQIGDVRIKLGETANSYRHEGQVPLGSSTRYQLRRFTEPKVMLVQAGGIKSDTFPGDGQTGYWSALERYSNGITSNNYFRAQLLSDSESGNALTFANASFIVFSGPSIHLAEAPPPEPVSEGLWSPALINASFENPALPSGGSQLGIASWFDSHNYTYTWDDGSTQHPDTPYGDNWCELGNGRFIYQQIGTYRENMDLDINFLVGKRTGSVGLKIQVKLLAGGDAALAADTTEYPVVNPLVDTVGASIITNSGEFSTPSAGTSEKSCTLSTGTGYAEGIPLWLQIYVSSSISGRILIDNVQVVDLDSDVDGMPDAWEEQYFTNGTAALPGGNADGDMSGNLEEYIAGTNPTNAASFFLVTDFRSTDASGVIIEWTSATNRLYRVSWAPTLTNSFTFFSGDIEHPQNSYTDTDHPGNDQGFYKVDVRLK